MFQETNIGFEYSNDRFLAFFGKHNSTIQNLRSHYPYLDWSWAKQVHGDQLLEAPVSSDQKADAQWTRVSGLGLIVMTADCIPVLAVHKPSSVVMAIHAGWRGVANRIIPKSFQQLQSASEPLTDWQIFIGPHILQFSFEVQNDTLKALADSTPLDETEWVNSSNGHHNVDLYKIVVAQMMEVGISESQIQSLLLDTKTDLRLHSFRRDKDLSGRQRSFIALIS